MSRLQQSAIKEIARELALGNTCYIHRYSKEITTIDHSIEEVALLTAQDQQEVELEKKLGDYVKIKKLSTQAQLVIMRDFLDELPDRSVRKQLSNALSRKNPVRNFNQAIESDIELNQHWRNFNFEEYQEFVSKAIIDAHNF